MEMDPFFTVPEGAQAPTPAAPAQEPSVAASGASPLMSPPTTTGNPSSKPGSRPASSTAMPTQSSTVSSTSGKVVPSLEEANEEIALLLESGKVTMQEVSALQNMMRDHAALREKVGKLKSLLGRSAKAQRETKMELEATQKRLDQALREVDRLSQKVEKLANRPTHMDLLADFETNFDRALLTVGQAGGQDSQSDLPIIEATPDSSSAGATATTATSAFGGAAAVATDGNKNDAIVDGMLMQELSESKQRIERLESLNSALLHRSSQLEQEAKDVQKEKEVAHQALDRTQLELKMAQMEAEHATRMLHDKQASLDEMQLEIDLVTKASVDANVRAAQGEQAAKSVLTDRQHVQQLELQVQALQEWALASSEAKRLSQEHVLSLEKQLKMYRGDEQDNKTTQAAGGERLLFKKASSLVIGAGLVGIAVMEQTEKLREHERVVLRWKFDITPSDMSVDYSILKGKCDTPAKQTNADYLIKDRVVTGGAGGETEAAFVVQNACTLMWSNVKSWVRPRTIKYEVEAYAVQD